MPLSMAFGGRRSLRFVLAAFPAGALTIAATASARSQPVAADPVSFFLGQSLALATLQAQAVERLRLRLTPAAPGESTWLTGATHILIWLDALTLETGADWGDGRCSLTESEVAALAGKPAWRTRVMGDG